MLSSSNKSFAPYIISSSCLGCIFFCAVLFICDPQAIAYADAFTSDSHHSMSRYSHSTRARFPSTISMMASPSIKPHRFITNKMCPFAQKAWIALETSQAPYQLEQISLYGSGGKPDWFWKLNPQGTVPVLVCNSDNNNNNSNINNDFAVLPDSDLILDRFEQGLVPGCQVSLSVSDLSLSQQQAANAWRQRINQMLSVGKKSVFSGSISSSLQSQLKEMDQSVAKPYLVGDKLTTADCHAFPFLWRMDSEFDLTPYPNLQTWLQKCIQEPSFQKTIQSSWWWWW